MPFLNETSSHYCLATQHGHFAYNVCFFVNATIRKTFVAFIKLFESKYKEEVLKYTTNFSLHRGTVVRIFGQNFWLGCFSVFNFKL